MRKMTKLITTAVAAVAMTLSLSTINSAFAYSKNGSWMLHYNEYDSKTTQTIYLAADGNGYTATCTSKYGNVATNYVTISAPYMYTTGAITEVGQPVSLIPSHFDNDYITFTVRFYHTANGATCSNGGTIQGN